MLCVGSVPGRVGHVSLASWRLETGASTQPDYRFGDAEIAISPALPAEGDSIHVIVSGWCPDSRIPSCQSHQVLGNVIRVDAAFEFDPWKVWLPVITPWQCSADLGSLAAGLYQVAFYVNNVLCRSKWFTVFGELHRTFLPVVAR
jgi:hypothetical protein